MSGARLKVHSKKPGLEIALDDNRAIKGWLMEDNGVFYRIKNGHVDSTIMLNLDAILAMYALMRNLIDVKCPSYSINPDGMILKNNNYVKTREIVDDLNKGALAIAISNEARPKPTLMSRLERNIEDFVTLLHKKPN